MSTLEIDEMTFGSAARSSTFLVVRTLLWAIVLPGVVVGYVPWRFFGVAQS